MTSRATTRETLRRYEFMRVLVPLIATMSCGDGRNGLITGDFGDRTADVISLNPLEPTGVMTAGVAATVHVSTNGAHGAITGAKVHWEATDGNGSVSVSESQSDSGGYASTSWNLPTKIGTYTLSARVGTLPPAVFNCRVIPARAIKHMLGTDTIHFTAQGQLRPLALTAQDAYGNNSPTGFTALQSSLVDAVVTGETTSLRTRPGIATHARAWARFVWSPEPTDSVLIVVDLVPVSAGIAGLDTNSGATVGETVRVKVDVRDSLNNVIVAPDLPDLGASFSSSDPSVATADPAQGTLTALKRGTTTVTATLGSWHYSATLNVYDRWEIPFAPIVNGFSNDPEYSPTSNILVDAEGGAIVIQNILFHSGLNTPSTFVSSAGSYSWGRTFGVGAPVALARTGQLYVVDSGKVHALDRRTGADLWSASADAMFLGTTVDGDAIVRGSKSLMRFGVTGTKKWSTAVTDNPKPPVVTSTSVFWVNPDRVSAFSLAGEPEPGVAATSGIVASVPSGGLYVATASELIALSPTGSEQWRVGLSSQPSKVVPTSAGPIVLVTDMTTKLTAVQPVSGAVAWTRTVGPTMGVEGNDKAQVIVKTRDHLWMLDAATGAVTQRSLPLSPPTTPFGFAYLPMSLSGNRIVVTEFPYKAAWGAAVDFGPYR